MNNIGDRIREARELRKLSQGDLAERVGLHPAAISHFETGKRRPSVGNLVKLCTALCVSSDFLLGMKHNKYPWARRAEEILEKIDKLTADRIDILDKFINVLADD